MCPEPVKSYRSRWQEVILVTGLWRPALDRRVLLTASGTMAVVVVGSALAALSPLVLKALVDAVSLLLRPHTEPPPVFLLGLEYLTLLMLARTLGDLRPLLSSALNQRVNHRLTQQFFGHVMALPMAYLYRRRSGELLHSLDLASAGAQLVITHLASSLLPVLVELVTMTAVLVHLDQPALIGVFASAALAYIVIFSAGAQRMTSAARAVSSASLEMAAQLGEGVANVETLRCFAAEKEASDRLSGASGSLELSWRRLHRLNLVMALAASSVFVLSMATCLLIGERAVGQHAMTIGGFVLTTVYMLQMVRPLESLGSAARDLARALGYLQPFIKLLSEPVMPEANSAPQACSAPARAAPPRCALAISIENLHFAYESSRPVLRGLNLDVAAGGMTAIVGRSGSGKSSLGRLLMRLYEPQQGHILLNGRSIQSINGAELRGGLIGFVPQETALLNDTIAYNIALGMPMATREDIRGAACAAQLDGLIDRLPLGLDTRVGERGMQLSGGERQRVGIARALLRRPPLFLLDEPTSMLDVKTEIDIMRALRSAVHGATLIVIAHRLSTIADASEIVVLDDGRVRERGRHARLLAMNGLYAEMWRRQKASDA